MIHSIHCKLLITPPFHLLSPPPSSPPLLSSLLSPLFSFLFFSPVANELAHSNSYTAPRPEVISEQTRQRSRSHDSHTANSIHPHHPHPHHPHHPHQHQHQQSPAVAPSLANSHRGTGHGPPDTSALVSSRSLHKKVLSSMSIKKEEFPPSPPSSPPPPYSEFDTGHQRFTSLSQQVGEQCSQPSQQSYAQSQGHRMHRARSQGYVSSRTRVHQFATTPTTTPTPTPQGDGGSTANEGTLV